MGIRVLITSVVICFMSFDFCTPVTTDFCFEDITIVHYGCFDFSRVSPVACILRLVRVGSPFSTVCTSTTLTDSVWFHYIIFLPDCTTDFITIQIFFWKVAFVVHIPPGTAVVVHINDIALHFRERSIITDNPLRLNLPQHFVVACHKPFFLSFVMVAFGRHIGGEQPRYFLFLYLENRNQMWIHHPSL